MRFTQVRWNLPVLDIESLHAVLFERGLLKLCTLWNYSTFSIKTRKRHAILAQSCYSWRLLFTTFFQGLKRIINCFNRKCSRSCKNTEDFAKGSYLRSIVMHVCKGIFSRILIFLSRFMHDLVRAVTIRLIMLTWFCKKDCFRAIAYVYRILAR